MSVLRSAFSGKTTSVARLAFTPASHLQASSFASSSRVGLDFTRPRRDEAATSSASSASSIPSPLPPPPSSGSKTTTPIARSSLAVGGGGPRSTGVSTPAGTSSSAATSTPRTRGGGRADADEYSNPLDRAKADNENITHTLTVTSTRNNVFLTFADHVGPVVPTISAGTGQAFKHSQRSTHEASHQATVKMIDQVLTAYRTCGRRDIRIRVAFKGVFGQGREAVAACIGGSDGAELRRLIVRLEDRTPFKIGGTRAPKQRRL